MTTDPNTIVNFWTETRMRYSDGTAYRGRLDRFGNRVGFGTFTYATKTVDTYSRPFGWMDYRDEANGYGGDGTVVVLFE